MVFFIFYCLFNFCLLFFCFVLFLFGLLVPLNGIKKYLA